MNPNILGECAQRLIETAEMMTASTSTTATSTTVNTTLSSSSGSAAIKFCFDMHVFEGVYSFVRNIYFVSLGRSYLILSMVALQYIFLSRPALPEQIMLRQAIFSLLDFWFLFNATLLLSNLTSAGVFSI